MIYTLFNSIWQSRGFIPYFMIGSISMCAADRSSRLDRAGSCLWHRPLYRAAAHPAEKLKEDAVK
jgi:hypothetical protein